MNETEHKEQTEFIIYETDNKVAKVSVRLEEETVWLTQAQLADLFMTSRPNITMHIKNILEEGELQVISVCKDFLHTAADGKKYNTKYYNLDMIISLGYMQGYSVCSDRRLDNIRAIWLAEVRNDKVSLWHIYPDTEENRKFLNI
jgi:hypothetical protein